MTFIILFKFQVTYKVDRYQSHFIDVATKRSTTENGTVEIGAKIYVSSKFIFDYSTFWKGLGLVRSGIFGTLSNIGPIIFNTHFDLLKV